MPIRETSNQAYSDLKSSGTQQTQAELLFDIISGFRYHTTNRTVGYTLQELKKLSGLDINAVSGRVNGLKKTGRVVELDKRKCGVTGRTVIPVGLPEKDCKQKELF